ncbi:hypothetical protein [Nitrospira sp. Kam-Ns4a]
MAGKELKPIPAQELSASLSGRSLAEAALRFMAVTALVDGVLDQAKIEIVLDYAGTLDIREGYLRQLEAAIGHKLDWALADMTKQNIRSLWDQPWRDEDDVMALILPYQGDRVDPALVARHEALGSLPQHSFGRAYWEIYKKNGYAFPGDPRGVNAAFARPPRLHTRAQRLRHDAAGRAPRLHVYGWHASQAPDGRPHPAGDLQLVPGH